MRSVVVVLPASMWAMIPMLRVFSRLYLRGMEEGSLCVLACGGCRRFCVFGGVLDGRKKTGPVGPGSSAWRHPKDGAMSRGSPWERIGARGGGTQRVLMPPERIPMLAAAKRPVGRRFARADTACLTPAHAPPARRTRGAGPARAARGARRGGRVRGARLRGRAGGGGVVGGRAGAGPAPGAQRARGRRAV